VEGESLRVYGLMAVVAIFAAGMCSGASAQETSAVPVLRAEQVTSPKIDGILDDPCWKDCAKLTGFKSNPHGTDSTEQTEVMICCDSSMLYVAFICHDSHPSLIRATQKQRNGSIGSDDYIALFLDPLHTHLQHYDFEVTALGTQYENIPNGSADNITWRGDWYAAAKITDTGWVAEMAIPFKMLRYPSKASTIGIAFQRYMPRIDETDVWPDLGPNKEMARYADLTDLQLPSQRGRPVFMPYSVTSREPDHSFGQIGFDYKEELPNNVIAMMTYNPDFTDIQDAVASIDYSYTERRLPESRPFFYEGCQMFIDDEAYYSRRIGDIDMGLKTFGKVGPTSFTFLDGIKQGQSNHFTSSYGYDFDRDTGMSVSMSGSTVEQAYKANPTDPDSSMCFSSGGFRRWRSESGTTTFNIRQFSAINSNGVSNGTRLKAGLDKAEAAGHLGYSVDYEDTDSTFYVRDGYAPLTGVRGVSTGLGYPNNPATGRFCYWDVYTNQKRYWAEAGGLHHESIDLGASISTRSEWDVAAYVSDGSWLGGRDATKLLQIAWLSRHLYGGGSAGYINGKRAGLDYKYWWCDQSLKIASKLMITCQYEFTKLAEERNSQFTILSNYDITPEQSLGVWIVGHESKVNLCCTYKQTVRSGSDIYLIYGFPNTDTTQNRFAVKIVRPMEW